MLRTLLDVPADIPAEILLPLMFFLRLLRRELPCGY